MAEPFDFNPAENGQAGRTFAPLTEAGEYVDPVWVFGGFLGVALLAAILIAVQRQLNKRSRPKTVNHAPLLRPVESSPRREAMFRNAPQTGSYAARPPEADTRRREEAGPSTDAVHRLPGGSLNVAAGAEMRCNFLGQKQAFAVKVERVEEEGIVIELPETEPDKTATLFDLADFGYEKKLEYIPVQKGAWARCFVVLDEVFCSFTTEIDATELERSSLCRLKHTEIVQVTPRHEPPPVEFAARLRFRYMPYHARYDFSNAPESMVKEGVGQLETLAVDGCVLRTKAAFQYAIGGQVQFPLKVLDDEPDFTAELSVENVEKLEKDRGLRLKLRFVELDREARKILQRAVHMIRLANENRRRIKRRTKSGRFVREPEGKKAPARVRTDGGTVPAAQPAPEGKPTSTIFDRLREPVLDDASTRVFTNGMKLHFRSESRGLAFVAPVINVSENDFVVTLPKPEPGGETLREGDRVACTVRLGNAFYGFETDVTELLHGALRACRLAHADELTLTRSRAFYRVDSDLPATFHVMPRSMQENDIDVFFDQVQRQESPRESGRVIDLSLGGCCLRTKSPYFFAPDQVLQVWLELPENDAKAAPEDPAQAVVLRCVVVRSAPLPAKEGRGSTLHLKFRDLDEKTQQTLGDYIEVLLD